MMLNLTDVLLDDKRIAAEAVIGLKELEFSFGSFPVEKSGPVLITVEKDEKGNLEIDGKGMVSVRIPCDRCLDDVTVPLELDFVEKVPQRAEVSPEEARRGPESEDDDISALDPDCYLDGYNLDVDKLLFGEALLNWPSRVLCKEDCRGLCPVCGQNLNRGDCGCERKALDPRMAKVLDVFSKFKEV